MSACSDKKEKLGKLVKEEGFIKSEISRLDSLKDLNTAMLSTSNFGNDVSSKNQAEINDSLLVIFDSRYKIERIKLNQQLDSVRREIALLSPESID